MKYFFEKWENKSDLEKKAIVSFRKGLHLILKTVPKKEIVAIYVKGSFVNRELNDKSDVDFVTILKTGKFAKRLKDLHKRHINKIFPQVQLNPSYTVRELRTAKRRKKYPSNTSPSSFVRHLGHYQLVYGIELDKNKLKTNSNEKDLENIINFLLNYFIPEFEKRERGQETKQIIGLSSIVKQVFWVTELELRIRGIQFDLTYNGINNAVRSRNHIIHEAYKLRINPTKDKMLRKKFILKLKRHLEKLKEEK